MEPNYQEIISKAYLGFNARDIAAVLALMHPNVHWPKAFDGGYAIGYEEIRVYWTHQWTEINPIVEPVSINARADGKVAVEVHQLVKDMEGNILFDGNVKHVYKIENNLILSMDIEL